MKHFWFIAIVCLLLPASVDALSISPVRQTLILDDGTSKLVEIAVFNESPELIFVQGEVDAFGINEENGNIRYGVHDEAKRWVTPQGGPQPLAPGEEKKISFLVDIPKGVPPASHYLTLFASAEPTNAGNVTAKTRVGSLFFLHVAGQVTEDLQVLDFSTRREWYTKGPVDVQVLLENKGNILAFLDGKVQIHHPWGGIWYEEDIPLGQKVLAGNRWKQRFDGIDLTWRDIGKHEVSIALTYGAQGKGLTAHTSFYYIPVWLYLGAGFLIFLGGMSMLSQFRKGVKRVLRKKHET